MKIKLTVITENKKPIELLGENPEQTIKATWNIVLKYLSSLSENEDSAYVENVEIMRGENDAD